MTKAFARIGWLSLLLAGSAWAEAPARDLSAYKEAPVSGEALLVVAYAVLWALVGLFVARLLQRQSRLEREVQALQARLEREP